MLKSLSLALLALCLALPAQAGDQEAMVGAAKAHQAKFVAAMNGGDMEALASCYADDALYYPVMGPLELQGKEAITASFAAMVEGAPGAVVELNAAEYIVMGDAVLSYGTWKMTMPAPEGEEPMVMEGRFTDLVRKVDGEWKYVFDHASVPAAAH